MKNGTPDKLFAKYVCLLQKFWDWHYKRGRNEHRNKNCVGVKGENFELKKISFLEAEGNQMKSKHVLTNSPKKSRIFFSQSLLESVTQGT